jgi:hypothetical protein
MPNEAYIQTHDLWQAWQAVCLSGAGIADLKTLAAYDVDPTEDDAEERVIEIIQDYCACERADNFRKEAA